VPDHEFLFALHLSDVGRSEWIEEIDGMLSDLMNSMLRHAGYTAATIAQLAEELRAGVAGCRTSGECDVQFRAHAGELEIVVTQGDRRIFRTSRRLPD